MKLTPHENLSSTVRMVVNPCDSGRSMTKSIAIWDQGRMGTGKGMSLPTGKVLRVLHFERVDNEVSKE